MSILKKTREATQGFRPAVPMQPNTNTENQVNETIKQKSGVDSIIEGMASEIVENRHRTRVKQNPIDKLDRTMAIVVSPRIEAQWRYHANLQNRSIASFVRQAVDFYIREHK